MRDLEFVGDYRQPQLSVRQRALGHDGTSAGEFTFGDFIDIINPLQHLPVVSTLYRELTGDEISAHARILGGTLFGGPTGFLSSIANVFYEEVAGEAIGETLIAFFQGEEGHEDAPQFAGEQDKPAPPLAAVGQAPAPPAPLAEPPDAAPGMLTGQAALDALFMDLRGGRRNEAGLPLAGDEPGFLPLPGRRADGADATFYPLAPRHIPAPPASAKAAHPAEAMAATPIPSTEDPEGAVHPLLFAQESAGGALADRMMQALDKYRAMAREGAGERRTEGDGERRPEENRALWQSDPASDPARAPGAPAGAV